MTIFTHSHIISKLDEKFWMRNRPNFYLFTENLDISIEQVSLSDSWTNHYFESNIFIESLDQVHKTSLNDLFMNEIQFSSSAHWLTY